MNVPIYLVAALFVVLWSTYKEVMISKKLNLQDGLNTKVVEFLLYPT